MTIDFRARAEEMRAYVRLLEEISDLERAARPQEIPTGSKRWPPSRGDRKPQPLLAPQRDFSALRSPDCSAIEPHAPDTINGS
jgi:hypothetical protein